MHYVPSGRLQDPPADDVRMCRPSLDGRRPRDTVRGLSEIARDNAALARRLWAAASQGAPDPLVQLDAKIVWKNYGHGPEAGEFHGIDAVLGHLANFGDFVDDVRSELLEVLSNESGAVIRYRAFMTRGTKKLQCDYSLWLKIQDGVVKRASMVPFEDDRSDAFWRVD